jgi:heterodisulfide reductase subunit B
MKTCREVFVMVLQSQDRNLSFFERVGLRVHLLACDACSIFVRQNKVLSVRMKAWRAYREDTDY